MDDENISRGLAVLAEDMPTPDIGDIVTTARARIRRRRSINATWIGTAAVVGLLAGSAVLTGNHPWTSSAAPPTTGPVSEPNNTPVIDDRARALDDQLNKAKPDVVPTGLTISPDPNDPIRVDGRVLDFEFHTTASDPAVTSLTDRGGKPLGPPLFAGRSYGLEVKLSDGQGWGTLEITIMHTAGPQSELIPSCAGFGGTCVPDDLPDGTKAIVTSDESARGYLNFGTDIRMEALRPDGTYIDIFCTNLPNQQGPIGPNPMTHPTRPQPPLSQADLLKFATAFTY